MRKVDVFWKNALKLRHLRLLVAIDEHRHIGRVAAALNVTQPAVSKSLAEVEEGLGLKLFERTSTGVQPTAYGRCLIDHARSLDADLTRTRDRLKALVAGESGTISIGVLPAAATALLPKTLSLFRTRAPQANVIVREGPFEVLLPELRARKVDLLLGTLRPGPASRDLAEKVLASPPLALAARKGHPLSRSRRVTWKQLVDCQWVLPPVGSSLRQPLENEFERNGIPVPTNCLETNATHLICSYLALTDAIAFLHEDLLRHISRRSGLCVLPLRLTGLLRPTGVMWSHGYPLEPLAQRFLACLEETTGSVPAG